MRTLVRAVAALAIAACSSPPIHTVPAPPPSPSEPPPPVVAVPDPGPPGLRLTRDVVPVRARVELHVDPAADAFTGKIAFDVNVMNAAAVVWLNATELKVQAATIGGAPARIIPGGEDHVGLMLDRSVSPGPTTLEVTYSGKIDHEKSRGIYVEKEAEVPYAYTFFESTDARRAFPCFDEPSFKIPWTLSFIVKQDHVALGNAPIAHELPLPDGMKRVDLVESKPMPSYLVAFVVGPFEVIDDGVAGRAKTPVRFIVPRGRASELAYAKEVTPKIVAALEDYFDMDYPYVKLDVAIVPRYWGTMEHPGIVAMGQPLALIRPEAATRDRKEWYANILAHELGHYWFGDYVTLAWWDDTWLNEALGEWFDLKITDAAEPSWRILDRRQARAQAAMRADEALSTQQIRQPVTTKEAIEGNFDAQIVYEKGSAVLTTFEEFVGADKWRDFMRGWVRAHAWGNASADDFFAAANTAFGADVERGLRSFVEQPGVPVISAQLACPKLKLHQERSLPAGIVDPQPKHWTVPVCVRYGDARSAHRGCVMMTGKNAELPLEGACPTWVVLAAGGVSYYRAAEDAAQAKLLLTATTPVARAASLSVTEKLMLVEDLHAAVDRATLTVDKVLALANLLLADKDPRVAKAAWTATTLRTSGLDDALYAKYAAFMVRTWRPMATRLGWKRNPSDSDDLHELRALSQIAAYYDAALAAKARPLVLAWLDSRSALDDSLADRALAAAAHHGDADLFDKILAQARTPRDRTDQQRLLVALGEFTDPALVDRALALVAGTQFDLRDSVGILETLVGNRESRAAALAFTEAHLDDLIARVRDDEASWLLQAIAQVPCDQATYDRVVKLVTPRADKLGGRAAAVTRAFEQARACMATTARELPALQAFLK